jgi:rhodanese-related sulfurtransferase
MFKISRTLIIGILILSFVCGFAGGFLYQIFASQNDISSQRDVAYDKIISVPLTEISSYTLLQRMNVSDLGFVIVDTRDKAAYNLGHIKGAISMTIDEIPARYKELPTNKDIITYCWSSECMLGPTVSSVLASLGVKNIKELRIGWCEWAERGYPIDGTRYILSSECLQPQRSINNETVKIIDSVSASNSGLSCSVNSTNQTC